MNESVIIAMLINLETLDNIELSSGYNALTGFNRVDKQNLGYKALFELGMLNQNGTAISEELIEAMSIEINTRIDNGEFN